jgi:hypothetical protein
LRVSGQYLEDLSLKYEKERLAQQDSLNKRNTSYKCHYSSIFNAIFSDKELIKDESFILSLIFDERIIQKLDEIVGDQASYYFDHYIVLLAKKYRSLGDKIISHSNIYSFKSTVLWQGLVSQALVEKMIKNGFILMVHSFFQEKVIGLYGSEEAKYFLASESESVRLAAYNKIGAIKCIDAMLADKSAKVRLRAIEVMDSSDERISGLINDTSKKVFGEVLKKIEDEKLPLLIGNKHLKDKHFKRYFEERFVTAKS